MAERPQVAIIGAGIAGMSAAWYLREHAHLTIFEKRGRLGGHTRALTVPDGPDEGLAVDTGFIVMNHRNYPHFTRLLQEWDVALEDSDMSFSYHAVGSKDAYAGTGLRGLFPTWSTLTSRDHWTMLRDMRKFAHVGEEMLESTEDDIPLDDFLARHAFSDAFRDRYLYAMGAAIWSSPPSALGQFPTRSYLSFFHNHGLLTLKNRPQWRVVKGGSQRYIDSLTTRWDVEIELATTLETVSRPGNRPTLRFADGSRREFDHVIFACHADQAMQLLSDPSRRELATVGQWSYQANDVVLHTDSSVMPKSRAAWASWNFCRERNPDDSLPVSVTYWMNRLQNLTSHNEYFVTLNRQADLDESKVINRTVLWHPVMDTRSMGTQKAIRDNNGIDNTWFCGSYLGYGFHEDAVKSSVDLTQKLIPAL